MPTLTLMHLPDDVLRDMLDFLGGSYGDVESIKSSRLVCRRLCELASPLLLPTVTINLGQSSLDRLNHILTTNPLVASGIRKVVVALEYCPELLATDSLRFAVFRWSQIGRVLRLVHCDTELFGNRRNDRQELQRAVTKMEVVKSAWKSEFERWRPLVDQVTDEMLAAFKAEDAVFSDEQLDYRQTLFRGHDEFRRLHQEQQRLVVDGTFVDAVASAIARIGHPVSVSVIHNKGEPFFSYVGFAKSLLCDEMTLPRLLTQPLTWSDIVNNVPESSDREPGLLAARVLAELPIAISKASPEFPLLKHYKILGFPASLETDYSCIAPRHNLWGWADLATACSALPKLSFSAANPRGELESRLAPSQLKHVHTFLATCLSSPSLKKIDLDLQGFATCKDRFENRPRQLFQATKLLASPPNQGFPRLHCVYLSSMAVEQAALEAFCSSIGDSLEFVSLYDVRLIGKSWLKVTDTLRDAIRRRKAWLQRVRYEEPVCFEGLHGGELGPLPLSTMDVMLASMRVTPGEAAKALVMLKLMGYVACAVEDAVNPLLDPKLMGEMSQHFEHEDNSEEEF
ncbi:hypothetical protein QBC42DRAFT_104327 [Cladorrhinum samala]|uniref:F-box domain-containing protein n=1 Tax=Cladorrhinum samala TaxID=585594 RepID=A0AAV9HI75_9PEZI|nr:hypothetical protein QBC42DRAFT_104327 [Cladorrhinum samala]